MDLREPEGVLRIACVELLAMTSVRGIGASVPVRARSLSPTKMAASYWCLLRASCRQFLRNSSILGVEAGAVAIFLLRDPPGTLLLVSPRDVTAALDVGSGGMADGCGQEEMDWWGVDIYTGSLGDALR